MRRSGSLRLRLMLGAGITTLATLGLALFAMSLLFSRHIERRVAEELERDALRALAALSLDDGGLPQMGGDGPADPRYETPAGGRYWQMSTDAGKVRSISLWDESLPAPARPDTDAWSRREADGPFGQRILLLERQVAHDEADDPIVLQVAQNIADLRVARDQFRRELGLFLSALWLFLVVGAWIQISLGLRPLARLRGELVRLERNPQDRLGQRYPREVEPLTEAINRLAEAREQDLQRARRRAADLAHSLKTPLAAMAALGRRVRQAGQDALADDLERVLAAARAALEAELARSRAAAIRDGAGTARTAPARVAEGIVDVVQRTERGGMLVYSIEIDPALQAPIAGDDLMEVLGALVENATRFARRHVRLHGGGDADACWLCVEDDGHGLNISVDEALSRGGRLDEAGGGNHGLGLSIARDIVEASGGGLRLDRSPLGGLRVRIDWPAAGDG